MSLINITNMIVLNKQDLFLSPIKIDITFEVLQSLPWEIEWSVIYIGSSKDSQYDQILDQFAMGPLQQGVMQFTIETNPPNHMLIPSKDDLLGVTAIMISVSYVKREFFRCGYYVYNNYIAPELIENDPPQIIIDQVYRHIQVENPRVTRFTINWDTQDQYILQMDNNNQMNNNNQMGQQMSQNNNNQMGQQMGQNNHNFMFNSNQQQIFGDVTNQMLSQQNGIQDENGIKNQNQQDQIYNQQQYGRMQNIF